MMSLRHIIYVTLKQCNTSFKCFSAEARFNSACKFIQAGEGVTSGSQFSDVSCSNCLFLPINTCYSASHL